MHTHENNLLNETGNPAGVAECGPCRYPQQHQGEKEGLHRGMALGLPYGIQFYYSYFSDAIAT